MLLPTKVRLILDVWWCVFMKLPVIRTRLLCYTWKNVIIKPVKRYQNHLLADARKMNFVGCLSWVQKYWCHDTHTHTHTHTLSALLSPFGGNPPVTEGFHLQRVRNVDLWCFLWCSMWRHCDVRLMLYVGLLSLAGIRYGSAKRD